MTLFRTTALSGLAVLTKLATSLFLNKVLAVYVGPAGYGVIGQFQSLVSLVTTFSSGAVSTGVTKYTAEYAAEPARQREVWVTALMLGLLGAAVCGIVLVLAREPLSRWLLGTAEQSSVFIWLGSSLSLLVANALMLAILNGRKAVPQFIAANIVGSVVSAAVATVLVLAHGLWGALVALSVSQAVSCGFTALMFRRVCRLRLRDLLGRINPRITRLLGGFALMAATSALAAPLGQMMIRNQLSITLGWEVVGLWQALWKISETHLLLLTSTLSVYFLPRFSEIRVGSDLRAEVLKGYRFILPLVVASGAGLYWFREPVILGLLSKDFIPILEALGFQLVGDVLKIGSWLVAFTLLSQARTYTFIITEILFTALLVVSTIALGTHFGLRGTAWAYGFTYALYWITMHHLFNRLVHSLPPAPLPQGQTHPSAALPAGPANGRSLANPSIGNQE